MSHCLPCSMSAPGVGAVLCLLFCVSLELRKLCGTEVVCLDVCLSSEEIRCNGEPRKGKSWTLKMQSPHYFCPTTERAGREEGLKKGQDLPGWALWEVQCNHCPAVSIKQFSVDLSFLWIQTYCGQLPHSLHLHCQYNVRWSQVRVTVCDAISKRQLVRSF